MDEFSELNYTELVNLIIEKNKMIDNLNEKNKNYLNEIRIQQTNIGTLNEIISKQSLLIDKFINKNKILKKEVYDLKKVLYNY